MFTVKQQNKLTRDISKNKSARFYIELYENNKLLEQFERRFLHGLPIMVQWTITESIVLNTDNIIIKIFSIDKKLIACQKINQPHHTYHMIPCDTFRLSLGVTYD